MSNINYCILTELSLDDIANHLKIHKKKYLTAALAGLVGTAGHYALKHAPQKIKELKHKHHSPSLLTDEIKKHISDNREAYAGAALGGASSLLSSSGQSASQRLGKGAVGTLLGGLTGSALGNVRKNTEFQQQLKINELSNGRK